ncbi:MAG: LacI family DNA-binding transcriptional regulator [Peptostreptococcaceae bacterium]
MNIRDIAKLAGVGVSTVSRVLNNHPDVKDSTRESILQIVKESNYIPNNSARILKQNNTKNIGVLVKGMFNPFFSEMINIIGCRINDLGYTMILKQSYLDEERDIDVLKGFVKEKRLQGVIALGGNFFDMTKQDVDDINIPLVITSPNNCNKEINDKFSYISIDNENASYEATKFLLNQGHRDIVLMIADSFSEQGLNKERLAGFKRALKDNEIEFDECNLLEGYYRYDLSYDACKNLLSKNDKITAIFATSDNMAIGCAKAIVDMGKIVGRDISIIGFDGMDISEYYNPPISTVKQPKDVMAKKSIDLLFGLINKKQEHKHIILDTELVIRKSSQNKN